MAKELNLWIYEAHVVGQHRIVLVADHTVGGAKSRSSTHVGTPTGKTGIPASAPGFPSWVTAPGVWISYVPSNTPGVKDLTRGLDRYSQEHSTVAPKVRPGREDAYLRADSVHEAELQLNLFLQALLASVKSTDLLVEA